MNATISFALLYYRQSLPCYEDQNRLNKERLYSLLLLMPNKIIAEVSIPLINVPLSHYPSITCFIIGRSNEKPLGRMLQETYGIKLVIVKYLHLYKVFGLYEYHKVTPVSRFMS